MASDEHERTFPGSQGAPLAAVLHRPPGRLRGCAIFAHCFTCSKDLRAAREVSFRLATHGFATLRFDFTGLGASGGDFADTTFSSNVEDLVAAASFLEREIEAPMLLVGHSLGGAAVLAAASRLDSVRAVATIGAPADPAHVAKLFADRACDIERDGHAEVVLAGRSFRVRREFLEDLERHASAEAIAKLGKALLLFHSPQDTVVGIDNARRIYQAARHPKSFVSLNGADHLLSRAADARYVADVLAAWASRYLPFAPEPLDHDEVCVEARQSLLNRVRAGHHELVADEPHELGGTDLGPAPYPYLLTALGSCSSMTLRLYADRKGWPLEGVRVRLSYQRGKTETGTPLTVLSRRIALEGNLDDAQRARLMEIADRCPVHRTLTGEIRIESEEDKPDSPER